MRPVLMFAIAFDLLTMVLVSVLLYVDLLPRELGAGLLGAVIGVRARWADDHDNRGGPPSHVVQRSPLGPPPIVGASREHLAREVLEASALGKLFGWSKMLGVFE